MTFLGDGYFADRTGVPSYRHAIPDPFVIVDSFEAATAEWYHSWNLTPNACIIAVAHVGGKEPVGKTFKATFHKGRIEPREPVEFREGAELVVTVEEADTNAGAPDPRPDIWAGYDAEAVVAALRESAGAFAGVDREQLMADIHKAREQGSHGRP